MREARFTGQMQSGENAEIVRTILTLAYNMGMDVVAEGIGRPEQFAQLKSLQCEYGQEYLFSKPVVAAATEVLFARNPHRHTGI